MVSASLTPASVHGVSQPRPASISLPTSQNTRMESAGTGMTGKQGDFLWFVFNRVDICRNLRFFFFNLNRYCNTFELLLIILHN